MNLICPKVSLELDDQTSEICSQFQCSVGGDIHFDQVEQSRDSFVPSPRLTTIQAKPQRLEIDVAQKALCGAQGSCRGLL